MANRYEIGKELGKGSFAKVFLCRKKNGSDRSTWKYFAIKVINVTECKQQQGASKAKLLQSPYSQHFQYYSRRN